MGTAENPRNGVLGDSTRRRPVHSTAATERQGGRAWRPWDGFVQTGRPRGHRELGNSAERRVASWKGISDLSPMRAAMHQALLTGARLLVSLPALLGAHVLVSNSTELQRLP